MIKLPKDAEGREIPLDTECLYTHDGEKQDVFSFTYYREKDRWEIETDMRIVNSIYLYLTPPDSWEKLEEDLKRAANSTTYECCAYLGGNGTECASCKANDENTCEKFVMENIASRIRKLRGED